MPIFRKESPKYKKAKTATANWNNFRGGLNELLDPTEIDKNELAQATNLKLIGKGIPTKREGTKKYFLAGATGSIEGIKGYYTSDGTNEVLAVSGGIMAKKSGASYSEISGASFASGSKVQMVTLNDNMYIVDANGPLTKYDGTNLSSFATLSTPQNVLVSNLSGVSGTRFRSWRVSAVGKIGETLASSNATLGNLPEDVTDTTVQVTWDSVSAASGDLLGYNIYGREYGEERLVATVEDESTTFLDDGSKEENLFAEPPTSDTTGGFTADAIVKFKDKLVMKDVDNPSRIVWSGGGPYIENFHWSKGGGFLDISKNDGDEIRDIRSFQNKIIVFKERSIWQVTLSADRGVVIPSLTLVTASHGAVGPRSVTEMENDLVFMSRDGIFVLGNEPGIIADVLRTAELSVKVRPTMDAIVDNQLDNVSLVYHDKRLWVAYPTVDQERNTEILTFDRERGAWMGPYNIGVKGWEVYYDSNNSEHLLYGKTQSPQVNELTSTVRTDEGSSFTTILRTKQEGFEAWNLLKVIRDVFFHLSKVKGSVSINIIIESDDGTIVTEKSFTVSVEDTSSSAGIGTDGIGLSQLGVSSNDGTVTSLDEIRRWVKLHKTAYAYQVEIKTTDANATYELLDIKSEAVAQGRGRIKTSTQI